MYKSPLMNLHWAVGPTFGKLIYDLMMLGVHKEVLEIGSHKGYSTSSFVQSLNDGCDFNFSTCDIKIHSELRTIAGSCKKNINIIKSDSESVIDPKFDFIFIDGNHKIPTAGRELQLILKCKTKSVLFHDINLYYDNSIFLGSHLIKQVMEAHRDYFYLEYKDFVLGDITHFGIGLATRDKDFYLMANNIFKRIGRNHKLL